jgi:hypothetical protein
MKQQEQEKMKTCWKPDCLKVRGKDRPVLLALKRVIMLELHVTEGGFSPATQVMSEMFS